MCWRLAGRLNPASRRLLRGVEEAWLAAAPGVRRAKFSPSRFEFVERNGLALENRVYEADAFRKMHLEAAVRDDGLQVVHCVAFPRDSTALPIFGADVVGYGPRTSFAIVDATPVHVGGLPPRLDATVERLLARHGQVPARRTAASWADVFSSACVMTRPASGADADAFVAYATDLARVHAGWLPLSASAAGGRRAVRAAHARYCAAQLRNVKTRQILEKALGRVAADRYMREVMFDL